MNDQLIGAALTLIQRVPTDSTLRAGLVGVGYQADDVDRHLEYMVEERLASVHHAPNQPVLWRLKLRGKEILDGLTRTPIGFRTL